VLFSKRSFEQVSFMALQPSENCHICSGFSGFPKHKQSVNATGVLPLATVFAVASNTARCAVKYGLISPILGLCATTAEKPTSRIS
jgi:hypothetical protein